MVLSIHTGLKKSLKRLSGSPAKRQKSGAMTSSTNAKDKNSNVKVVVRVRPQNERETESSQPSIVKVLDENILVFDPKEESEDFYFRGKKQRGRDLLKKSKKDLKLAFDYVFDGNSTNEEVFNNTTKSVVDGLINGYNCSVFAYGATGAGKTHTMLGNPENPGITFLTVMELYRRIEEMKDEKTCDVAVSYLEVYNETIHDLLMTSHSLALREDPQRGVVVTGLSLHKPKNAQDLLSMLQFGNKNRTQHPTDANAESSRSHAVFMVYVKQQDRTAGLQANVRVAKMVLIDLAGSERATVSLNSGARLREGANINKSLLALGNCINSLADKKSKGQHIPYRDSKLTRLLKDSLGGNCQTVMIAAVSPSNLSYEDTYNTLRYADRAKAIKSHLKKNVMSVDMHVTKYVKMVEDLRKEISELREKLKMKDEEISSFSSKSLETPASVVVETSESTELHSQLDKLFNERQKIQNDILDIEIADRQLDLRHYWRHTNLERLSYLSKDNLKIEKSTHKTDHASKLMERKRARWRSKKPSTIVRFEENVEQLAKLQNNITLCEIKSPQKQLDYLNVCVELNGVKRQNDYLKQVLRMQELEASRSEHILCDALKLIRQQQLILTGHGFLTTDLVSFYENLHKEVEGSKEVVWADQEVKKKSLKNSLDIEKLLNLPLPTANGTNNVFDGNETLNRSCITDVDTSNSDNDAVMATPVVGSSPSFRLRSGSSSIPNKVPKLDQSSFESSVSEYTSSSSTESNVMNSFSSMSPLISPKLSSASASIVKKINSLDIHSSKKNKDISSSVTSNSMMKEMKSSEKENAKLKSGELLTADILFEPPPALYNENVKKCLTKQFASPNLNKTFEQSESNLDETFAGIGDLNGTFTVANSSQSKSFTKPNVTFADAVKSPVPKRSNGLSPKFGSKTPSRTPLSAMNTSSFKNMSTKKSQDVDKKPGSSKLKRTNSVYQLRSGNSENRLRKFSSVSTLPATMTKTALLRNIMNRTNSESVSKLKNLTKDKMKRPFHRFI